MNINSRVPGVMSVLSKAIQKISGLILATRLRRLLAGVLVSFGLLWLVGRGVSWVDVAVAVGSARLSLIGVAVVCVLLATLLRAWCWLSLLLSPTVTLFRTWQLVLIGQFLNICVPVRAGDFARVYLMGESGNTTRHAAATSLALEKFFDAMTLLLFLGPIALFVDLPASIERAGDVFIGVAGLVMIVVFALV